MANGVPVIDPLAAFEPLIKSVRAGEADQSAKVFNAARAFNQLQDARVKINQLEQQQAVINDFVADMSVSLTNEVSILNGVSATGDPFAEAAQYKKMMTMFTAQPTRTVTVDENGNPSMTEIQGRKSVNNALGVFVNNSRQGAELIDTIVKGANDPRRHSFQEYDAQGNPIEGKIMSMSPNTLLSAVGNYSAAKYVVDSSEGNLKSQRAKFYGFEYDASTGKLLNLDDSLNRRSIMREADVLSKTRGIDINSAMAQVKARSNGVKQAIASREEFGLTEEQQAAANQWANSQLGDVSDPNSIYSSMLLHNPQAAPMVVEAFHTVAALNQNPDALKNNPAKFERAASVMSAAVSGKFEQELRLNAVKKGGAPTTFSEALQIEKNVRYINSNERPSDAQAVQGVIPNDPVAAEAALRQAEIEKAERLLTDINSSKFINIPTSGTQEATIFFQDILQESIDAAGRKIGFVDKVIVTLPAGEDRDDLIEQLDELRGNKLALESMHKMYELKSKPKGHFTRALKAIAGGPIATALDSGALGFEIGEDMIAEKAALEALEELAFEDPDLDFIGKTDGASLSRFSDIMIAAGAESDTLQAMGNSAKTVVELNASITRNQAWLDKNEAGLRRAKEAFGTRVGMDSGANIETIFQSEKERAGNYKRQLDAVKMIFKEKDLNRKIADTQSKIQARGDKVELSRDKLAVLAKDVESKIIRREAQSDIGRQRATTQAKDVASKVKSRDAKTALEARKVQVQEDSLGLKRSEVDARVRQEEQEFRQRVNEARQRGLRFDFQNMEATARSQKLLSDAGLDPSALNLPQPQGSVNLLASAFSADPGKFIREGEDIPSDMPNAVFQQIPGSNVRILFNDGKPVLK